MVHVVVVHVVDQRILELCMYVIMYVCVCMYVVLFEEEKTDTRIIYTYVGLCELIAEHVSCLVEHVYLIPRAHLFQD